MEQQSIRARCTAPSAPGLLLTALASASLFAAVARAETPGQAPAVDGRAGIAIVRDGADDRYQRLSSRVLDYLTELAGDDYEIDVPLELDGDFTLEGSSRALRAALADPRVELVYTAGPLATEVAATLPAAVRTKPVFGGFPELSEREDLLVRSTGRSAVPNFTFVATPRRVSSDLRKLRELTGEGTLHIVIDEEFLKLLESETSRVAAMEQRVGAKIYFHGVAASAVEALKRIPAEAKAVYISILPRMSFPEFTSMLQGLTQRNAFTLSMAGPVAIQYGVTATLAADLLDPVSRRSALNLHQLALGADTGDLQIYLPSQDALLINAPVARAIGWSADYETFLSAQFIGDMRLATAETLTLEDAMERAAVHNADARTAVHAAEVSAADLRIARGNLLPRIDAQSATSWERIDGRIDPLLSLEKGHGGRYGVSLQQILFDDRVLSGFRSQRRLTRASELERRSAELDARAEAGTAYLRYLQQQELYEIEKDNLRLTEGNRTLSRLRVEIGTAEPTEVFRWESEVARDRADLITRGAQRDSALIELNRILGVPRATEWKIEPIALRDDEYYFLDEVLSEVMDDRMAADRLDGFFGDLAIENSPELAAFDQSLEAQGILLGQRKRAYYTPSLNLEAGYDRVVRGGEGIDTDGEDQFALGVVVSLPLFEGLQRPANVAREAALVRQLSAQRAAALERIDQTARATLVTLHADHANMRLSRRATYAASRNYDSVLEKYSQGAATILDTLDAQAGLLLQRQQSAGALYEYLIDVVSLQRSIAWFEADAESDEVAALGRRLSEAVHTPHAEAAAGDASK